MSEYVIGGDVGSSGYKSVLLNLNTGEIKATVNIPYEITWVKENWAEQNPYLWKEAFIKGTKELLEKTGVKGKEIQGISFSGQQHGAVLVDEANVPLYNAILWCCQRSAGECKEIEERLAKESGEDNFYVKEIGIHALPGFQGPKILWIYKNLPGIYKKIKKLLFPKDWLKIEISREKNWTTELSDLSGSGYLNLKGELSEPVMRAMKINREWIPEILPSTLEVGTLSKEIAVHTGLKEGIKVYGGGGDNPCSMIGNNAILLESVGTSGTFSAKVKEHIVDGTLHPFILPDDRFNYPHGPRQSLHCIIDAASAIDYTVTKIYGKNNFTYEVLNEMAKETPPGSGGIIVIPFIHGQRVPYLPYARLYIQRYNPRRHKKRYLIRATMEGVGYAMKYGFELLRKGMEKQNIPEPLQVTITGGGAKGEEFSQIRADIYAKELVNFHTEGAAAGASYIAAAGVLDRPIREVLKRLFKPFEFTRIKPREDNIKIYEKGYESYLEVLEEAIERRFKQKSLII